MTLRIDAKPATGDARARAPRARLRQARRRSARRQAARSGSSRSGSRSWSRSAAPIALGRNAPHGARALSMPAPAVPPHQRARRALRLGRPPGARLGRRLRVHQLPDRLPQAHQADGEDPAPRPEPRRRVPPRHLHRRSRERHPRAPRRLRAALPREPGAAGRSSPARSATLETTVVKGFKIAMGKEEIAAGQRHLRASSTARSWSSSTRGHHPRLLRRRRRGHRPR